MASFPQRVIGVLKLQAATFEDVEHDPTAAPQAALVVVVASVARSLGAVLLGGVYFPGFAAILLTVFQSLVGWVVAAAALWIIGTRVLPGRNTQATFGELLRTTGFAHAPIMLAIIGIIPFLGPFLAFLTVVWAVIAVVVAVRQALDYDETFRALMVCILALVAMIIVRMLLSLLGIGARVF